MRDNHDGCPEILDAFARGGYYFGIVRLSIPGQTATFEFGVDQKGYYALKRVLQSRPFDQLPGLPRRYFYSGSWGVDDGLVGFRVRVEQGRLARNVGFNGPQALVDNLDWFCRLIENRDFGPALHLRRDDVAGLVGSTTMGSAAPSGLLMSTPESTLSTQADDGFPLRFGNRGAFAALQTFLDGSGYTEEFILKHFEIPHLHYMLYSYGLQREHLEARYPGEGLPLFLTRTFIGGYADTREQFASHLEAGAFAACLDLGLLVEEEAGRLRCPVVLYPALGFYIASDRGFRPEGPAYRGKDYVMSGTEHLCRQFIKGVAQTPCERFLDMGTGSGLAALVGTGFATHCWGVDITRRAVRYAEFNRQLNGRENLTVVEGDLFAPVTGLTFDRIASNPPFEPPLKEGMIFSVGGVDGEAILARLVAEVPGFLEAGGRLYCQVSGTDREGDPFDARVRRWLGDRADECDTAVFVRVALKPTEYAIQQVLGENQDSWKLQEWHMFYHKLKAEQVLLGHLILQKRAAERPVFHVRRSFGPESGIAEMDWLVDWMTACQSPGIVDRVMAARVGNRAGWELIVRHEMREGKLGPQSCEFVQTHPFDYKMEAPPWMAMLAGRCDGQHTGAEQYEWLKDKVAMSREVFVKRVCELVSAGVLVLEEGGN
jgi:methylase of polypeptide subunit release factors